MNLHPVTNKHFINSLSAANIGAYIDTVNGNVKNLVIKDIGLTIPYISGSTTIETTSTTTGQVFAGILQVSKVAPCDECESLEYYVGIRQDERIPGRNNSEAYPKLFPYGGKLTGKEMTISGGYISEANVEAIGADIVDQISTHNNSEWGPEVYAARAYKFTAIGAGGTDVTVASSSLGITTITVDHGTYGTQALKTAALIVAINATGLAYAFPVSGVDYAIWVIPIGANDGHWVNTDPWTIGANDATVTGLDADGCFIGLYGIDTEKGIKVTLEENAQFTLTVLQNHEFPTLTSNDVFEEFMLDPNDGMLAQFRRGTVPTDTSWTRYVIQWQTAVPSLSEGAGHQNTMKHMLKLYIPSSEVASTTDKWDATNFMRQTGDTGFAADRYWAELLAWWQNDAAIDKFGTGKFEFDGTAGADELLVFHVNGVTFPLTIVNTTQDQAAATLLAALIDAHPNFVATVTSPDDVVNVSAVSGTIYSVAVTGTLTTQTCVASLL